MGEAIDRPLDMLLRALEAVAPRLRLREGCMLTLTLALRGTVGGACLLSLSGLEISWSGFSSSSWVCRARGFPLMGGVWLLSSGS